MGFYSIGVNDEDFAVCLLGKEDFFTAEVLSCTLNGSFRQYLRCFVEIMHLWKPYFVQTKLLLNVQIEILFQRVSALEPTKKTKYI